MDKAIVVVGPTASGKTKLGVHIAKRFNGEVISADSMQVYKGMAISTAKPTLEEMQGIKHHLIDFVDIEDRYSVSDFCYDAEKAFTEIKKVNKTPVIVGGTGLYIDSFLNNTKFLDNASDENIKKELQAELNEKGADYLYQKLQSIDKEAALKIHPNNTVRVLRALEVYYASGVTITEQEKNSRREKSHIEPLYIGITYSDRNKLYDRINKRVDIMLQNGLLEEAKNVFSKDLSLTAFNSIGCKEMKPYLDKEKTLDACVEDLKKSTRHYAKRQLTWFRRNERINWFYPDIVSEVELYNSVDNLVLKFLEGEQFEEK